jgi:3-hydroxyisobutyrate dehydrogenase-like beta-hydroxyacid dehydrogenase
MNVTIVGTGNRARGIGSRLIAGGRDVTVLGKHIAAAEAVVGDGTGCSTALEILA